MIDDFVVTPESPAHLARCTKGAYDKAMRDFKRHGTNLETLQGMRPYVASHVERLRQCNGEIVLASRLGDLNAIDDAIAALEAAATWMNTLQSSF